LVIHRQRGVAVVISAFLASTASAGESGGGLVGWVENTHGAPVAGAVVSVFGRGVGQGGLVTLTDSAGQFVLPRLPAGSYTLRALGDGHVPAAARKFTVLPDRDATFTVSLTPVGDATPEDKASSADAATVPESEDAAAAREWRWLMRHKRRSVLEDREGEPLPAPAPTTVQVADTMSLRPSLPSIADVGGSLEFLATPIGSFTPTDASLGGQGALHLRGKLADGVQWNLGGLVTESQGTAWRMAAEFVLEPGGGTKIETGAGYGMGLARRFGTSDDPATDPRGVGAMFVRGKVKIADHVTASLGTRYSYFGFLSDPNHLDTMVAVDVESTPGTVVHGSVASRTLAPGGDLLTLSTRDSSPLIAYAKIGDDLRVSRTTHYELGVDRAVGPTALGARMFFEDTADQLVNVFAAYPSSGSLAMTNANPLTSRGMALTVGHHFGPAVSGSVTYMYGKAHRSLPFEGAATAGMLPATAFFRQGDFHDVEARLETFIDVTDTRLQAYCRFNAMNPDSEMAGSAGTLTNTRFDIQLTQGLPFLQPLTRAEWEVLLAFRNLFYERAEGGVLDELVVLHPPKRVMGGIAVRF
jgi:carboxypeptidase family protein/TonB-dependent receptor-like protein